MIQLFCTTKWICYTYTYMSVCVCVCVCMHACMLSHFSPSWLFVTRLLCPQDSPGQNTGVGCHALLQGIFLIQGLNLLSLLLLHWQPGSLSFAPLGNSTTVYIKPIYIYMYIYIYIHTYITEYWVELPVLYSRSLLVINFVYHNVYMSIPVSQFIPPPLTPDKNNFVSYICDSFFCFVDKFICTFGFFFFFFLDSLYK